MKTVSTSFMQNFEIVTISRMSRDFGVHYNTVWCFLQRNEIRPIKTEFSLFGQRKSYFSADVYDRLKSYYEFKKNENTR